MKYFLSVLFSICIQIVLGQSSSICLYEHNSKEYHFNQLEERNDTVVIQIKVVIHILWFQQAENISDEQIQSQLLATNRDFNGIPKINCKLPNYYFNRIGNPRIQFCLATVDPNGNSTNGITRTLTAKQFNSTNLKDAALKSNGGIDAWNRDEYLNIWVVPFEDEVLGYSAGVTDKYFDGVFVNTKVFGTTGNLQPDYNLGHTLSHEIGHYFGLNHIWGGDSCNCDDDDNIEDTPKQACFNYDCSDVPKLSCGDYEMNYNLMDYTHDACRGYFTNGQSKLMRMVFENLRKNLSKNVSCTINLNFINQNIFCTHKTLFFDENVDILIVIYSIDGRIVYKLEEKEHYKIVDLSMLQNGIYLINKTINGKQTIEKIVIFN